MKRFLPLACLLVLGGMVRGQEQEKKLASRLMNPDMSLGAAGYDKAFYQGAQAGKSVGAKDANVKTFYDARPFLDAKPAYVKPWWGARLFGLGGKKYETEGVNTKSKYDLGADRVVKAQSVAVSDAREGGKKLSDRDRGYDTPTATPNGKAQKSLDLENEQTKRPKTIDEIRDLLNKNK